MDKVIQEFSDISRMIGTNPFWVQGPGGNTSIKLSDGRMIVKSSGSQLGAVNMNSGYTFVRPAEVNARLLHLTLERKDHEIRYAEIVESCGDRSFKRPSMELGFHTWLAQKYILHFHSPAAILAEYSSDNTCPFAIDRFSLLLPGFSLSSAIMKLEKLSLLHDQVFLLRNHGIILAVNRDPIAAMEKYRTWENKFWTSLNPRISYDMVSNREQLYSLAASVPVDNAPLFPDSVVIENRIAAVIDSIASGQTRLNMGKAVNDTGAADLYSIQMLTRLTAPDYPPLPESICQAIRNLPTELARKKLIAGQT